MTDVSHTRGWVRDVVRSGLLAPDAAYVEIRDAIAADHPALDAATTARQWIDTARGEWAADAAQWAEPTDYERLQNAFASLARRDILVVQGCADHWAAKDALNSSPGVRGVAWFLPSDVWHAIDEAMLEVNIWHADTANAAPGDALLDEVLAVFADAGLSAHFDEGRVEVTARWQRRPDAETG